MNYNPRIHHRRSTRLPDWDYSWAWWYYVTICSYKRECLFGEILGDIMELNDIGKIVNEEWLKTPSIRPELELDDYVIMPNHLHGIVIINDTKRVPVGTHGRASLHRAPRSLGSFVAGFKSSATKRINTVRATARAPMWQERFHDHIIRNDADLARIRTYIANNPLRWVLDEENPVNALLTRS